MLAHVIRSGLVEAEHAGSVAVVNPDGTLLFSTGDIDRPFFSRSAAKPFQATIAQEFGSDLDPVRLAVAASSHGGQAVHIALVRSILEEVGLNEDHLQTPPDWPLYKPAARRLAAEGRTRPERIFHNCSGKHAAMLRACAAARLDVDSYRSPDHPLQQANRELFEEASGRPVERIGVDGCGAPVFDVSVLALARAYARMATEDRFVPVWSAMHAYPYLASWTGFRPAGLATRAELAAKGGAEGCVGFAVRGRFGVAIKSWDGAQRGADVAAAALLGKLGVLPAHAQDEWLTRPAVLGGGQAVGAIEPDQAFQ